MGKRSITKRLLRLGEKKKKKRDKYEMGDGLVKKCLLLKLEMDGLSARMGVLKIRQAVEDFPEIKAIAERSERIARHMTRYRRLQIHLIGH